MVHSSPITIFFQRFEVAFALWQNKQTSSPETTQTLNANECLFNDIYRLGKIICCLDDKKRQLELDVLAKCLVEIKQSYASISRYTTERLLREIPDFYSPITVPLPIDASSLPNLTSIRVITEFASTEEERVTAAFLAESFLQLIDDLLLADSNITRNEETALKQLKLQFAAVYPA